MYQLCCYTMLHKKLKNRIWKDWIKIFQRKGRARRTRLSQLGLNHLFFWLGSVLLSHGQNSEFEITVRNRFRNWIKNEQSWLNHDHQSFFSDNHKIASWNTRRQTQTHSSFTDTEIQDNKLEPRMTSRWRCHKTKSVELCLFSRHVPRDSEWMDMMDPVQIFFKRMFLGCSRRF